MKSDGVAMSRNAHAALTRGSRETLAKLTRRQRRISIQLPSVNYRLVVSDFLRVDPPTVVEQLTKDVHPLRGARVHVRIERVAGDHLCVARGHAVNLRRGLAVDVDETRTGNTRVVPHELIREHSAGHADGATGLAHENVRRVRLVAIRMVAERATGQLRREHPRR